MNSATKNNSLNKNEKGFSLLEVIFAMAIITSGILSIMSLFSSNLRTEENNKNKLIAAYLAQEGIEVVRQARDNIWKGGDNNFLDNDSVFADGINYIIVPVNQSAIQQGWNIININDDDYRKIYINDNGNKRYYLQKNGNAPGSWVETGFTRYFEMADGSDGSQPAGCDINSCVEIISHVLYNDVELATVKAYLYDGWY